MLFNSLEFVFFFAIVYSLYLTFNHKNQNRLLLVASYIFYGWWNWKFTSLLFLSTVVDYFLALKIDQTDDRQKRKTFLILSISFSLGLLCFFKYTTFLFENLRYFVPFLGKGPDVLRNIILPAGISFYTFQTMSYVIDVYRRVIKPTRSFSDFALFVSFFPQLVAGPIERAGNLLPQVQTARQIKSEQVREGVYLIFLGYFQKIFVADNLAILVDRVFQGKIPLTGFAVLMGSYAFYFQILCDFAGYSDIGRGLAKCMGFELMINFKTPVFSINASELWRRWHISLAMWFRDYVYKPLNKKIKSEYLSLFITMTAVGLWHGAGWTYVLWGTYHSFLLIGQRILRRLFNAKGRGLAAAGWEGVGKRMTKNIFFFHWFVLGALLFRAEDLTQFKTMLGEIFFHFNFSWSQARYMGGWLVFFTWLLLAVQFLQRKGEDPLAVLKMPVLIRWPVYFLAFYSMLFWGNYNNKPFIYFFF